MIGWVLLALSLVSLAPAARAYSLAREERGWDRLTLLLIASFMICIAVATADEGCSRITGRPPLLPRTTDGKP